ncbi:putative F-box associated interaction domain-containing protein [Arabidopsis thaliana]
MRKARFTYDSYEVQVSKVFHCDGLLLCITKDHTKLLVWNPYWGQTKWIEPIHTSYQLELYSYAIGYDKSSRSYKILSFLDSYYPTTFVDIKIYECNSGSWRVLDVAAPDEQVDDYEGGVSLKGNTYWFVKEKPSETTVGEDDSFLVCFDFTKERFGPLLPLPFEWYPEDTATLSSVREEQLAVLFQRWDTSMWEIRITTKIEPNAVSWRSFLTEKEVAVVFGKVYKDENGYTNHRSHDLAYIVGVDGSLKKVYVGESPDRNCYPLVCSYVPSLV